MAFRKEKQARIDQQNRDRKGPGKHETGKDNSPAASVRKGKKPLVKSGVDNKVDGGTLGR